MKCYILVLFISVNGCAGIFTPPSPFLKNKNNIEIKQCNIKKESRYFVIDQFVPSEFHFEIIKAFEEWNNALGFQAFKYDGLNFKEIDYFKTESDTILIYFEKNIISPYDNAYGWTRLIYNDFGCIKVSDIAISSSILKYIEIDEKLFHDVILHEIGHTLGLAHSDSNGDIMRTYIRGTQQPKYNQYFEVMRPDNIFMIQGIHQISETEIEIIRKKYND